MKGKNMSAIKGITLGVAIGGATAMVGRSMMGKPMMGNSQKRKMKKSAKEVMNTVSDVINNAEKMMK